MRTAGLFLLIALCSISKSHAGLGEHPKQERLLRNKRRWVLSTIELEEEDPGPYPKPISKVYNNLPRTNYEFQISGQGVDEEPINTITINPETGEVFALRSIDREQYGQPFHIKFDILDKTTKEVLDKQLAFDIEITDINDNAPTFTLPHTIEVKENTPVGSLLERLEVIDKDQEQIDNSKITVSLVSQEPKEPKISMEHPTNTQVKLSLKSGCFDYDKIKQYEVRLKASDAGKPSLSSTAVITLNIVDGNTHPPMFKQTEYKGEVMELQTQMEVLRVGVEDKDTFKTPGWYAEYFFITGNEEGHYKIETDNETNEGVLTVVKGIDYETMTSVHLEVGVKNKEPLWVCKENPTNNQNKDFYDSVVITIKVKDANDPPTFPQDPVILHMVEEEKPGKVLFTPEVKDVDSDVSEIRNKFVFQWKVSMSPWAPGFVLIDDPENCVSIDRKTGKVTLVKTIDRESPALNGTGIYSIVIGAVDNEEPPATGTCTVQIHLQDINDNKPELVNKGVTICGNRDNKVMVAARDADDIPYGGPFYFSLKNDEKILKQWTLDPSFGHECGLVSKKALHYGNYSVPLEIRDQQNILAEETLEVMVCDCEEKNVCRSKKKTGTSLGSAGIGVAFVGILLFLLLLLIFSCQCRKAFKTMPFVQEEGYQNIIKYNEEGGMSECMSEPTLLLNSTEREATVDGVKKSLVQAPQCPPSKMDDAFEFRSLALGTMNSDMNALGGWRQRETLRRNRVQTTLSSDVSVFNSQRSLRNINRTGSTWQGGSTRHSQLLDQHIADHIDGRLYTVNGMHAESPEYQPICYAYEGLGSQCSSLDRLSSSDLRDDLTFLNNLGPSFNSLGQICLQNLEEKNTEL